jgi:co-chaperonin GroES (HSP10)
MTTMTPPETEPAADAAALPDTRWAQAVAKAEDRPGEEATATQLPKPRGYNILCALPDLEQRFEGTSILRVESHANREAMATTVLFVLDLGGTAYADKAKFGDEPWCKKGDFVMVRKYAGTRFTIHGKEFRLITDDQVEAVVEDPRGYGHV